ncbi:ABC transporter G family member 20 isoform X1 [Lepeophtheirus salmonis]|uniref:ABC transporter G family member 20 isoform X1 n=1 Tax=Lepeophtheirus salmonis TaxID=72036 RepID=UPI001AE288CE|nr:ABC transporter G family member 20-like isoform X1 [Lepeophtheirus salmonis]
MTDRTSLKTGFDRMNKPVNPICEDDDSSFKNMENEPRIVVALRDACKYYGKNAMENRVLNNLNLTITEGSIYGLLGASGCGKTTVLSCIVGRKKLNKGQVTVFGGSPGDKGIGIPGNRIGYMPQEIALYKEFTVRETLKYFGRLYEMETDQIDQRIDFILKFLQITRDRDMVGKLSGGQKRRVSFAAALLHDPELYILDEPTVGVDPRLRKSIWNHLTDLALNRKKTILITTHYIEEARQATSIGLMRNGKLLAESSPEKLLQIYGEPSLEDVFLTLCVSQDELNSIESFNYSTSFSNSLKKVVEGIFGIFRKKPPESIMISSTKISNANEDGHTSKGVYPVSYNKSSESIDSYSSTKPTNIDPKLLSNFSKNKFGNHRILSPKKLKALIMKNFIQMWRNIPNLLFIFLLPAIEVLLFCIAIGNDPTNLNFGIVNNEFPYASNASNYSCSTLQGCEFENLSCRFLSNLTNRKDLNFKYFEDEQLAKTEVLNGEIWGYMTISSNFSEAFLDRLWNTLNVDSESLLQSSLRVYLDMTNQQVSFSIKRIIFDSYKDFIGGLMTDCELPSELAASPVRYEDPIYGVENPSFTSFMAPGIIVIIIYFLAMALTGDAFLLERRDGLLDRSWVAGVSALEYILAVILTQFIVMIIQTIITLIFILIVFQITCNGPLLWLIVLTLLQGTAGMTFGFMNSAIFTDQSTAMQVALASFFPNLLLSGIIWPLEGMPYYLKTFSQILPSTAACQAMRDIMSRGWGVAYTSVYSGILISMSWITVFVLISVITIRLTV